MTEYDELPFGDAPPVSAVSTVRDKPAPHPVDPAKVRRGRQVRNYGNRAELDVARRYGGVKVGHAGGPVDVRGRDFATQVKTRRAAPPAMWKSALGAMAGSERCPRLLLRFVRPTGPEDFFVFRASDFVAWFGTDEGGKP